MRVPLLLLRQFVVALLLTLPLSGLLAQCTNTTQYPSNTTVPNSLGAVTQINTCSYQQEYSVVGPAIATASYEFTCTSGSYITVHEGSFDGPVIGNGYSPLTVTATASDLLYPHWNVDDACGEATGCQVTTVQLLLDCTPPTASVSTVDDCDNNEFSLDVNVTNLGDGTSVDIIHSVNGGADITLTGQPLGTYNLGPFTVGDLVDVTVAHSSDLICNLHFNDQQAGLCPVLVNCGDPALSGTYCYGDNDVHAWHWQNTTPGTPLSIVFSQGFVDYFYGYFGDQFVIYDGPDANSPILFQPPLYNSYDLTDLQLISSGTDLYMEIISDGYGSCQSYGYESWAWQVGCYDCTPPEATYSVVTDCDAQTFNVDVAITSLGSQSTLELTNDAGAATVSASAPGTYSVGPFPLETHTTITVQNDTNSLCNVHSPVMVNPVCPVYVNCGEDPLEYTYCYGDNDVHAWHWSNTTLGMPLSIVFSQGFVDYFYGNFGDQFVIYDGPDNNSPILFQPPLYNSYDLTDLQLISSGTDLYMEIISDGYGSCQSYGYEQWVWQVGCYDCTPPEATYSVVTDCDAQTFNVDVAITSLGSQSTLELTNDAGAATVSASAPGTYSVGPFPLETHTTITVQNDTNSLCNIHSPVLVNPVCPVYVNCGEDPLEYTYCYGDNDVHAWHWENTTPGTPLSMIFTAGFVDYFYGNVGDGDQFIIYDGPDNNSPILFQPPFYDSYDLTGLQVISTGSAIYMEIISDNYGSCESYGYQEWAWIVGCYDCAPPTATYTVVTDCDAFQYTVDVNISQMGSDAVIDITNDNGASPVPASATGTYTVGPFTAGTHTTVTLVNDVNGFCSVHSPVLLNPLCPTVLECGVDPITESYCYTNNDNHAWHWQCGCGSPLSFQFSSGQIESATYDHLRIYDGPDNSSPLLFDHTQSSQEELSGLLFISASSDIYMEMSSDGSVSCADGNEASWTWTVGCLDCTNPEATFSVVPDCQHATYQVAVNVANTGSSPTVRIANTASADTLENVPAGLTLVGPISMDSVSNLTVMNATNGLCRVFSPEQSSPFADCIIPISSAQNYSYCYVNTDTSYFAYKCTSDLPIAITFLAGQLLVNDYVQIYDSTHISPTSLVFQGNLNGNMAGYTINSTNPEHALVMRVVSDGTYSCQSGDATVGLNWTVDCGYAGIEEQNSKDFTMYPNPATSELYLRLPSDTRGSTEIKILDVSGRVVYQKRFTAAGAELNIFDLHSLQSGNYSVVVTTPNWVKAQNLQIIR